MRRDAGRRSQTLLKSKDNLRSVGHILIQELAPAGKLDVIQSTVPDIPNLLGMHANTSPSVGIFAASSGCAEVSRVC